MPIKLANNATAHLAAPLAVGDTTLVLVSGEVGGFPALAAGEYFPLTLVTPSGTREIVKVTNRSANVLTVTRAFDGTTALDFDAGALAEIRMTAGTIAQLQADTVQARTDMLAAMDTKDAALATSVLASAAATADSKDAALATTVLASAASTADTKDAALSTAVLASAAATADTKDAALSTALQATMDTKDAALHTTITAETTAAIAAIPAPVGTPVGAMLPWTLTTEPTGWIFADGRTLLSNTPYTALRAAYIGASFPHGQDGSGNPNIPDMRGRMALGRDNMGGTAINRIAASKTCTYTAGGAVITGITNTSNLYEGMQIFSADFAAGTVILTIDSASQITMSANATASGTAVATRFAALNPDTVGATGGSRIVTLTSSQIPAHTHTASTTAAGAHDHGAATAAGGGHTHTGTTDTAPNHTHTGGAAAGQPGTVESSGGASSGGTTTGAAGAHSHTLTIAAAATHTHAITAATDHTHAVTVNNTGGGQAHSILPPSMILNWIIRT